MRPLAELPSTLGAQIGWVLTDLDDTLTDSGRLQAAAYGAIDRLSRAGIVVVPVTGRPAGWCDHMARMWPVRGVIGENGAFYFTYDHNTRRMVRRYAKSRDERRNDAIRLERLAHDILEQVAGAAISADQAYRQSDLAIDFCEDVPPLPRTDVHRIKRIFEQAGAQAKISTIHVNGWFGRYDKLSMTRLFFEEVLDLDLETVRDRVVFCGDSPNDEPMFAYFPNAVGVANVSDFVGMLAYMPTWICSQRGGAGFAELAETLLLSRKCEHRCQGAV